MVHPSKQKGKKLPPHEAVGLGDIDVQRLMTPASFRFISFDESLRRKYELQRNRVLPREQIESGKRNIRKQIAEGIRTAWIASIGRVAQHHDIIPADIARKVLHKDQGVSNWFTGENEPGPWATVLIPGASSVFPPVVQSSWVWLHGIRQGLYWFEQDVMRERCGERRATVNEVLLLFEDHRIICENEKLFDCDVAARWENYSTTLIALFEIGCERFTRVWERWHIPFRTMLLELRDRELRIG